MLLQERVYPLDQQLFALPAQNLPPAAPVRKFIQRPVILLEEIVLVLEHGTDLGLASQPPLLLHRDLPAGEGVAYLPLDLLRPSVVNIVVCGWEDDILSAPVRLGNILL